MQTASGTRIVHTGSHWGLFDAEVEHNRVVGVRAFAADPHPSPIINTIPSAVHAASRIERPMVRQGWLAHGARATARGAASSPLWRCPGMRHSIWSLRNSSGSSQTYGNEAIYASSGWASAGVFHNAPTQLYRFLNGFGGFVSQVTNYSFGAASVIVPHVVGTMEPVGGAVTSWPTIARHTN